MYLRPGFPYLYISIYRYSHLKKLSMVSLFCFSRTFSKEKCSKLYLHVTRGSRNIFPWRLVKKDIRSRLIWGQPKFYRLESSQKRIWFSLALVSLMKMVLTWQYIRDTELNMPMACFGDRVENVPTLYMEIARASQRGEWYWRWAKKSCQSATHSFQLEQVRQEYILVYRVLKFHDAPLAWLKHEVKIVVRRGWG